MDVKCISNYKRAPLPKNGYIKLIDLPIGHWVDQETIIVESILESPFYISLEKNCENFFNVYCSKIKGSSIGVNDFTWNKFIKLKNDIESCGFKSPSEKNDFPPIFISEQCGQLDGHRRLAIIAHLYGVNTIVRIEEGFIAFEGANLKGDFITFSQNYEDVILFRALKHIKNGFYIDVGANDPVVDSVTKAFYDRGWSGVNIEPIKSHFDDLSIARNRDINLFCAAGDLHGHIDIWESNVRGWATASLDVIAMHEANGHVGAWQKVPVFPLRDICAEHAKKDIHFLKIDVEGFEKEVIYGMDFDKFRPWIVVVEATKPNSQEEVHHDWEVVLTGANYLLAYTDGLNRFYLASERLELLAFLRYPPNVFDRYIRFGHHVSETKAQQAQVKIQLAEAETRHAEAKAQQAAQQLMAIYQSRSWRITAPFRSVTYKARLFAQWAVGYLTLKRDFRLSIVMPYAILLVRNWVVSRPRLASRVRAFLNRFPIIKTRLRGLSQSNFIVHHGAGFVGSGRQGSLPCERIVRASDVKMSFFGTEFSGRFSRVGKLPVYIESWWEQQKISSQSGIVRYADVGRVNARSASKEDGRSRILQMTTYSLENPDHGGKLRCHHIRNALRTRFDVQTLSFEWGEYSDTRTKSVVLDKRKWGSLGIDGITSDFGINTYLDHESACYSKVANLVRDYSPDSIIIEQPFLWPLVERLMNDGIICKRVSVIYSSQNIEVHIKREIYKKYYPAVLASKYAAYVDAIEKAAIRSCSAAIAVTSDDAEYIRDVSPSKAISVYSNGHSKLGATSEDDKWRRRFSAQDRNWVFVGSCHPPNINGLRDLLKALKLLDDGTKRMALWVLGSVGNCLVNEAVGFRQDDFPWLHILGPVPGDDITSAIMCSSGVVLPIWEGGGSNLKTAQALLSGKCVLGSEFSFRGFENFSNEGGVSLTADADGLARLVVKSHPLERYPRSDSVAALTWEVILESLPAFVRDVVSQDDGLF